MKQWKLVALGVTLALAIAAAGKLYSVRPEAIAQTSGWQYQVGVNPDFGGNPATHLYSALYYCPSCIQFPSADEDYFSAVWTAGSDQDYSPNWFQVGWINNDPRQYGSGANQIVMETTVPLDPQGYSYVVCVAPYTSPTVGANDQTGGGCIGDAASIGLTNGNYYYAEIYSDNNCADGSAGCIYGCNGNRDLAINGVLIAHVADCSSADGIFGISGGVLEPTDANGVTPKSSTSLYSSYSYLGYIEATILGTTYTPNSLGQYCGAPPIDPPSGAGSIVYSTTEATLSTYGGTCPPGSQAPARGTTAVRTAAPPRPQPFVSGRTTTGTAPRPAPGPIATTAVQPKLTYDPARGNLPHYLPGLSRLKSTTPIVVRSSPTPTARPSVP